MSTVVMSQEIRNITDFGDLEVWKIRFFHDFSMHFPGFFPMVSSKKGADFLLLSEAKSEPLRHSLLRQGPTLSQG